MLVQCVATLDKTRSFEPCKNEKNYDNSFPVMQSLSIVSYKTKQGSNIQNLYFKYNIYIKM